MERYIDSGKLIKIINPYGLNNPLMRLQDIMRAIAITPTADVAPVVHAHWERLDKPKSKRDWYRCTNCGRVRSRDYDDEQSISEMLPYCNCGARMDEEATER